MHHTFHLKSEESSSGPRNIPAPSSQHQQSIAAVMASFLDNLFSLHGKTVLITGANRGLGAGMAEALGKAGASLVLVLRDVSKTESVDRYKQMGIETSSIQCDLGDPEQVGKLIAEAVELHRIDVLVNCGGIQRRYKAHDFPVKEFNEVVQVNYLTPAQLMRDIGAYWIKEKIQGKIINIACKCSFS
jgi:2-deoxy-D-gluconate 3-dehydrogenase